MAEKQADSDSGSNDSDLDKQFDEQFDRGQQKFAQLSEQYEKSDHQLSKLFGELSTHLDKVGRPRVDELIKIFGPPPPLLSELHEAGRSILSARPDEMKELFTPRPDAQLRLKAHIEGRQRDREAAKIDDVVTRAGDNLVSEGFYESYENTVYLTGACNVGKSTLASVFIGQEVPLQWKSTDGLVIYFGQNGIDLSKKIMVPLKEDLNLFSKVLRGKPDVEKARPDKDNDIRKTSNRHDNLMSNDGESSSFSAEDTSHKSSAEIECYRLTEEYIKGLKDGKYKVDIAASDLVDLGGQRTFDMTHQLFIRQNGTFVVMFDGRHGFLKFLPEYHGLKMTNEDIVKHWVNSILTYCVKGPSNLPMVLFAATHRDHFKKEDVELKRKEYLEILRGYFGDHSMKDHIALDKIYFINAKNPSDSELKDLQRRIVTIAMNQPNWGRKIPIKYVPLEMQISAMKNNNEYIVSKQTLKEANDLNGDLALSEDQFKAFLEYQHSNGKIMYINQPGLDEFVVLYPPAAVNILRSFITNEMFWPGGNISRILESMNKTGQLSKLQLEEIWSQKWVPVKSKEISDFVIKLLVHLDVLIIPQQYRDSDNTNFQMVENYLVPCIITETLPMKFLEDEGTFEERTISLVFSLKTPTVPPALAYKLIGALCSLWPLKEEDNKALLFQFAAVFSIDSENEMRVIIQSNDIIIYLTNKTSTASIQPDVAASIQECITNTLDYALMFYHSNIGIERIAIEASDYYVVKIGQVCNKQPCVLTIPDTKCTPTWVCNYGHKHHTDVASKWIFNRRLVTCSADCKGLSSQSLAQPVVDLHLIKLASKLDMKYFREMMIHHLDATILGDLEYDYKKALTLKFMGLKKWQDRSHPGSEPCLNDLQVALSAVGDNRHHLCQITRKVSHLEHIASIKFQSIPDDEVLWKLAHKMGDCIIHLGIELGLTVSSIEETMYRLPGNMFGQIYDILSKWKKDSTAKRVKPTIFRLMEAVNQVDFGGLVFLIDFYKQKQDV